MDASTVAPATSWGSNTILSPLKSGDTSPCVKSLRLSNKGLHPPVDLHRVVSPDEGMVEVPDAERDGGASSFGDDSFGENSFGENFFAEKFFREISFAGNSFGENSFGED